MEYALALAVFLSAHGFERHSAVPSLALTPQHWISNDLADDLFQLGEPILGYGIWTCGGSSNCFQLRDHPSREVKDRVLDAWLRTICTADRQEFQLAIE